MSEPAPQNRRVAVAWHRLAGWTCFRFRALERARRHFERVIALVGEDFRALVWLGRIAHKLHDYGGWKRAFARARRCDPARYQQLKHPFELFDTRGGDELEALDTVFDPAAVPLIPRPLAGDDGDPERGGDGRRGTAARLRAALDGGSAAAVADDFVSESERARFRGLAPIEPGTAKQVDLDELARRLSG
jgi:hypothetical protein